jgi:hypothetical protein
VPVGRRQLAAALIPARGEVVPLAEATALHLEQVGEVGLELQLDQKSDGVQGAIGDPERLADAFLDRSDQLEPHTAGPNRRLALEVLEQRVGQVQPRRVVGDGRRADPLPGPAVDAQAVCADVARVVGEDTLGLVGLHLTIVVRDHEGAALVDREDRRPDGDLDRHHAPAIAALGAVEPEADTEGSEEEGCAVARRGKVSGVARGGPGDRDHSPRRGHAGPVHPRSAARPPASGVPWPP